jgi:hypothetical protein
MSSERFHDRTGLVGQDLNLVLPDIDCLPQRLKSR